MVNPCRYDRPSLFPTIGNQPVGRLLGRAAEVLMLAMIVLLVAGLAMGYRPVILVSGSMAPTAPAGSLIIVTDIPRDQVAIDDIIVMSRGGGRLLTHRVVEIFEQDGRRVALTKGDANATPDPVAYELEANQRVVRFVAPVIGSLLLPMVGGAAAIVLAAALLLGLLLAARGGVPRQRLATDHGATGGWAPPKGPPIEVPVEVPEWL